MSYRVTRHDTRPAPSSLGGGGGHCTATAARTTLPALRTCARSGAAACQAKSAAAVVAAAVAAAMKTTTAAAVTATTHDDACAEAVRHTTAVRLQRDRAEAHADDVTVKIARQRYAMLLRDLAAQLPTYRSVELFVTAMMRELRLRDDVDAVMRAAAATWAMHLLVDAHTPPFRTRNDDDNDDDDNDDMRRDAAAADGVTRHAVTSGAALAAIADALWPVIYCHYDAHASYTAAAPALRQQLGTAADALLRRNPYLTHEMHVEQVGCGAERVREVRDALHAALRGNDARRACVLRCLAAQRTAQLRGVLRAWRAHVRRVRIHDTLTRQCVRRHTHECDALRTRAAFCQWRVLLEQSRNAFLTERLHESALQLESAKQQFQLQCHHTDRLVEASHRARDELHATQQHAQQLQQRVDALTAELAAREQRYAQQLQRHAQRSVTLLQRYATTLACVASDNDNTMCDDEAMTAVAADSVATATLAPSDATALAAARAALTDGGDNNSSSKAIRDTPGGRSDAAPLLTAEQLASFARECAADGGDDASGNNNDDNNSSSTRGETATTVLLRWCNGVLRDAAYAAAEAHVAAAAAAERDQTTVTTTTTTTTATGKPPAPRRRVAGAASSSSSQPLRVRNFGVDFGSGDAYATVVRHCFPDIPLPANTRTGRTLAGQTHRLRALHDALTPHFACVPTPADFAQRHEDVMVRALCELRARYEARQRRGLACRQLSGLLQQLQTSSSSSSHEQQPTQQQQQPASLPRLATVVAVAAGADAARCRRAGATHNADDDDDDDDAAFDACMRRYEQQHARLQCRLAQQRMREAQAARHGEVLLHTCTYLTRQRDRGMPVVHVSETSADARAFWSLKPKALNDLAVHVANSGSDSSATRERRSSSSSSNLSVLTSETAATARSGALPPYTAAAHHANSSNSIVSSSLQSTRLRHGGGGRRAASSLQLLPGWPSNAAAALSSVLRQHLQPLSRLFYAFAGDAARVMGEVDLWHWALTSSNVVDAMCVTRAFVSRMLDAVVSPALAAALRHVATSRTTTTATTATTATTTTAATATAATAATAAALSAVEVQAMTTQMQQDLDLRDVTAAHFVRLLVACAYARHGAQLGLVASVQRYLATLPLPHAYVTAASAHATHNEATTTATATATAAGTNGGALHSLLASYYARESRAVVRYFANDLARVFFFYLRRQARLRRARERAMALQDGGRFCALLSTNMYCLLLYECGYLADVAERASMPPPSSSSRPRAQRGSRDDDGDRDGDGDDATTIDANDDDQHNNTTTSRHRGSNDDDDDDDDAVSASLRRRVPAPPPPSSQRLVRASQRPRRRRSSSDTPYDAAAAAAGPIGYATRAFVSREQVEHALSLLQARYVSASGVALDELCFPVFLESFAVLCQHWCASPLVPPARKLAAFVAHTLSLLSARHASTTLVISAAPCIALDGGAHVDFAAEAAAMM